MTSEHKGHYGRKNSPDFSADPEVVKAINRLTSKKGMPCAAAFKVVKEMATEPRIVGATLDSLEIAITNCQLGLFGHGEGKGSNLKPIESISKNLEDAIRESLVDGKVSCKTAWDIAMRLGIRKMEVASACESLEIKVISCQLGAF